MMNMNVIYMNNDHIIYHIQYIYRDILMMNITGQHDLPFF